MNSKLTGEGDDEEAVKEHNYLSMYFLKQFLHLFYNEWRTLKHKTKI